MTEIEFLKQFAVVKYNRQYNRSFRPEDFTITALPLKPRNVVAYEARATMFNAFLRLRVYLELNSSFFLEDYTLDVDGTSHDGELGDEVLVTNGSLDVYYKQKGFYTFDQSLIFKPEESYLLMEDDTYLLLEDGRRIVLETEF